MKILVLGATGYIGGTVAMTLQAAGHTVNAIARNDRAQQELAQRGIDSTLCTLDEADKLSSLAADADIVINTASADHEVAVAAILRALQHTGKRYVHTSGGTIVAKDTRGEPSSVIYDEATPQQPPPERRARFALERTIRDAATHGVHASIICPGLVYGEGTGLKTYSLQVPELEREAHRGGKVRYIGRGHNVWSNVHVSDLADLFVLVMANAGSGAYFYAENGEASFREVAGALAARHDMPLESIDMATAIDIWGDKLARLSLGSSCRLRAVEARALGWAPRRPSLLETLYAA